MIGVRLLYDALAVFGPIGWRIPGGTLRPSEPLGRI